MSKFHQSIPEVPKYTCKRCEEEKILMEFARMKKSSLGHSRICKSCSKKAQTHKNKVKDFPPNNMNFGKIG